ncbi:AAA-ATPase At3g28610-like [Triticum dicoccoides]|uniref:AAA-ATPase At3g28610-like n=1 Tax=Triticum dicoccoides TaxID=85692 RepID=UPI0018915FEC|nr:AAA-ATPase At3g28610-like [Triticum dicoccoides]
MGSAGSRGTTKRSAAANALVQNLTNSAWMYLAPVAFGVARSLYNQHLRRRLGRHVPSVDPFVTVDVVARLGDPHPYHSYHDEEAKSSDAYAEVLAYLSAACSREARKLRAEGHGLVLGLRDGQEVADEFKGVTVWWCAVPPSPADARRRCRLTFHESHRRLVVDEYLPHVRRTGQELLSGNRPRRLYSANKSDNNYRKNYEVWSYVDFDHPATFETLAMNPAKKRMVMDDLDDFRDSRDYYSRIGKAWKRGYLLYGPPGTGKFSMVAAMANHLNYDVYDVDLASVHTNGDLRKLFAETTRRSIVVIEDIDRSLDHATTEPQRETLTHTHTPWCTDTPVHPTHAHTHALVLGPDAPSKSSARPYPHSTCPARTPWLIRPSLVTLPGLLSFMDGLWSAHGGERIIVVTTNWSRALDDPALARRGRMDVHIEMSYCEFGAFMTLAKNYLGVDAHPLFYAVEELLRVADMTPADVAECLMSRSERAARGDADACLARLVDELKRKAVVGKTAVKEKLVLLPGKESENQASVKGKGGEATADGKTS